MFVHRGQNGGASSSPGCYDVCISPSPRDEEEFVSNNKKKKGEGKEGAILTGSSCRSDSLGHAPSRCSAPNHIRRRPDPRSCSRNRMSDGIRAGPCCRCSPQEDPGSEEPRAGRPPNLSWTSSRRKTFRSSRHAHSFPRTVAAAVEILLLRNWWPPPPHLIEYEIYGL